MSLVRDQQRTVFCSLTAALDAAEETLLDPSFTIQPSKQMNFDQTQDYKWSGRMVVPCRSRTKLFGRSALLTSAATGCGVTWYVNDLPVTISLRSSRLTPTTGDLLRLLADDQLEIAMNGY
eukprot:2673283-Amphidinium_carterae.1